MSSLSARDKAVCEKIFEMEAGYVLDFSNNKLQSFILISVGIDIYESSGYEEYCSKANKLRQIFDRESDAVVGRLLIDLLDHRDVLIMKKAMANDEYIDNLSEYATQIRAIAEKMNEGAMTFSSNHERLNVNIIESQSILMDIISAAELVCNNPSYNTNTDEDPINDYIRDMLKMKGYSEIHDQTRHGESVRGNKAGEVDILLCKNGKEVALYEGLILRSVDSNEIRKHVDKALVNYNSLGTATFIVAYVNSADYAAFWNRYYNHLMGYNYPLIVKRRLSEQAYPNAAIRVADMICSKNEYDFPVYFMTINMRMA